MKTLENEINQLKTELDNVQRVSVSSGDTNKQVDSLKYEVMKLQAELKESQNLVTVTKQNEKSIQEICATFEKHNRELTSQLRTAEATHAAKVQELTQQVNTLSSQLQEKEKMLREQKVVAAPASAVRSAGETNIEVEELRQELERVREQLRASEMEREKAVTNYFRELQVHAEDSQALPKLKQELSEMKSALQTLENEKQASQARLVAYEAQLQARQGDVEAEKTRIRQELEEVRSQNETLYKALDELSTQCNQSLNEIENSEQELRGNENVISVIKHLRQQSSLARIDKQNVECENRVLKSDLDMLKRKLTESNELLNAERNKNQVNEKTLEKHAELVKKIEMMEVVSDSNRILREDRDRLQAQLNAVVKEKEAFDAKTVDPLKTKINQLVQDLEMRSQQVEHLKKQSEMWKKRSDELVEKANKSNPEDIKRLTLEKETLHKQLMSERESYRSNLEELKTLRAETANQREQVNQLCKQVDELKQAKEELGKVKSELETSKSELAQLTTVKAELETAKTELTTLTAQLETANQNLITKSTTLENMKKIAIRYKTQCAEATKEQEEREKAKLAKDEEDKARNEAHEALVKEKDELIAKYESEKLALEAEMNTFKATLTQREERMKEVLKKCRQKMASQVLEMNRLKNQAGVSGASLPAGPDYEEMERTIAELREERDKLTRDNEAMQQKHNLLSRHLSAQSVTETAKAAQEPPTANIKPMSGAVTPWRGTPSASIRPMISESRTVVVPPTLPQLEPSSSHMDYMPASSSAVRQATILPTTLQQTPLQQPPAQQARASGETAAESTQHEEVSVHVVFHRNLYIRSVQVSLLAKLAASKIMNIHICKFLQGGILYIDSHQCFAFTPQVESPELDQQQSSSAGSGPANAQAASIVALVLPQERQDSAIQQVIYFLAEH